MVVEVHEVRRDDLPSLWEGCMNIFALDEDPKLAAQMHLDKHVVKMIVEYAQLMSTAHRLLDGELKVFESPDGKSHKLHVLPGEKVSMIARQQNGPGVLTEGFLKKNPYKFVIENPKCYSASHQNHQCGVWARESDSNYLWLFSLFDALASEYTYRYSKQHKTWIDLKDFLRRAPRNIAAGDRTQFALAMGEEFKVTDDPIASYKNYYLGPKAAFAVWTNRQPPAWFAAGTKDYDVSNFTRTRSVA
jgi:hypothetical protein